MSVSSSLELSKNKLVLLSCFCLIGGALQGSSQEQTPEAIVLEDRLFQENKVHREGYNKFRSSLREKYPRGEDRVAALEKWDADHKAWHEDWKRRVKRLDDIWSWGMEGKSTTLDRVEDLSSATGKVAAAMRRIRRETKGTGQTGDSIDSWRKENKTLISDAAIERVNAVPAPQKQLRIPETEEELAFDQARRKLTRIRQQLLKEGISTLQAAMRDSQSEYSRQKRVMIKTITP